MTNVDKSATSRRGVVQTTAALVVEQARSLAGLVAAAGSGAVGALPGPVSNTAARLLAGLEQLIEEVPSITDELDVLVDELHAKRLSIQALSAELAALDALRDRRAQRRAVEWLLDQGLIEEGAAQQFATDHPDPDLP